MSASVTIDLPLPDSVPTPPVKVDYTAATVPQDIKDKIIKNSVLFVDVVNAGPEVGTGLEDWEATDQGLIKNHWTFRGHIDVGKEGQEDNGQVSFGMDAVVFSDIGSNEGQYARSSNRSNPDSGSNFAYSPISTFSKPLAPASIEDVLFALPLAPASGEGSHDSHDSHSVVFSDVESVGKPPNITSSDGHLFQQPTEGAPHPGVFNIRVRGRTVPSISIVAVFKLELDPGTKFGQLLEALSDMEPFFFRKIGVAYLGCRDFISQATAKWLEGGLLVSGQAETVMGGPDMDDESQVEGGNEADAMHIFKLLGWRYTNPLVPVDVTDPSGNTMRGAVRRRNLIDRAVWPENFVHFEDGKLKYNQVIVGATA